MTETPVLSATNLLNKYGISDPTEISIEELIWAQGAIYLEKPMTGAEGRIVFGDNNSAAIVVNKGIKNQGKKRFVQAHELGHLRLHRSLRPFFNCDVEAFMERNKAGSHEAEANSFASELLMPRSLFSSICNDEAFSVNLIKEIANRFQTSLTATAFRYVELGLEPIAFLLLQNGVIRWATKSSGFIAPYIPAGGELPVNSYTYRCLSQNITPEKPDLVMANVWFNNRRIPNELLFYEQCIPLPSLNGALIFIWMSNFYK